MKNLIVKAKRQFKHEGTKAGLIILGAVGGVLLAKGIRKLTKDNPSLDAFAEYATPLVLAGGGLVITLITEEKSVLKGLGYGLTAAGSIEGVKLIPVAKEFLAGILGETEIPAANAFLTENEERNKLMNGFGMASLPVGNATMQEVPLEANFLPELEGVEEEFSGNDLGYNPGQTDDADRVGDIL